MTQEDKSATEEALAKPMLESNIIVNRALAGDGKSVFAEARKRLYSTVYSVTLRMDTLVGGTPADPAKLAAWIRTKFPDSTADSRIMQAITEVAVAIAQETGVAPDRDVAVEAVVDKNLNVFKRDANSGELIIEGRQVKSMLKECVNIRWPKNRWGPTNKGPRSWFSEHCFVLEDSIGLGIYEPTRIQERFVHTWRGNGISRDEVAEGCELSFTMALDTDDVISQDMWGELFVTGEMNGLGAVRSQGYGTFVVTRFDKIEAK